MNPVDAMTKLDEYASELDKLSKDLTTLDERFERVADEYQAFIDGYEVGLWRKHVEGAKLPAEALRIKLARQEMSPQLLGDYEALRRARKDKEARVRHLTSLANSQRSILSALKEEMIASGGGLRRAA